MRALSRNLARPQVLAVGALVFLAAVGTLNVRDATVPSSRIEGVTYRSDPRAGRLAAFFKAYNCPQPHHVQAYIRAADAYGLDYRLLPAISVRETTCGVAEKDNNRWGYHPGRQRFASVEEGIDFLARQLAEKAPYVGKTLREKLFTYNPRAAYPAEVESMMRQIE